MLHIQVLQIDGLLVRECMEDALEEWPVLVPMYPLLILTRPYLFKLEAGEGVKCEPEPVFPFYNKITDEQTLGCARQI